MSITKAVLKKTRWYAVYHYTSETDFFNWKDLSEWLKREIKDGYVDIKTVYGPVEGRVGDHMYIDVHVSVFPFGKYQRVHKGDWIVRDERGFLHVLSNEEFNNLFDVMVEE